jgi:hypothetical protein
MNLDTLDPARGLRQLARMFTLLDDRVDLIEQDLDSDTAGSLAAAIGDLRDELRDLRIIVEEHRRATA